MNCGNCNAQIESDAAVGVCPDCEWRWSGGSVNPQWHPPRLPRLIEIATCTACPYYHRGLTQCWHPKVATGADYETRAKNARSLLREEDGQRQTPDDLPPGWCPLSHWPTAY